MNISIATTKGVDNSVLNNFHNRSSVEKSDDCSLATLKVTNVVNRNTKMSIQSNNNNANNIAQCEAFLDSFFNLFGDSRDEARRILDEYTRTPFSESLLRAERGQQLHNLYEAAVPVEDFRLVQLFDAIANAFYLHGANVLLPGIRVLGGNQTANSSLTASASTTGNSNQQVSTFGGEVHAANTEVESSSSMSYVAARDLFPKSD